MVGQRGRAALRRRAIRSAVLVAPLLLGACSDDDSAATTTSRPEQTTTTEQGSSTTAEEAEVLAAYRAFWFDAYLAAADPMDPSHPALEQHATGTQLERLQRAFLARQANREVIRGTLELDPRVASIEGETATVRDCYLDNTGVYDAETGERHDTPTGVRHLITATLVLENDAWKVSDLEQEGDGCSAP